MMKTIEAATRESGIREGAALVGILTTFAFLLRDPALTAACARDGAALFLRAVLPATLPYMVLAGLLSSGGGLALVGRKLGFLRRCLWISEEGVGVFLMGLLSGFPVGAKMAAELYADGSISREEAERLAAVCNFCGPPFLIAVVGAGLPGGKWSGLILWLLQTALAFLSGFLAGQRAKRRGLPLPDGRRAKRRKQGAFSLRFTSAVRSACESILLIFGFVLFFAVFSGIVSVIMESLGAPPLLAACLCGWLELSGGTAALSALSTAPFLKCFLLGCFSVFSGFSVHMQVGAFLLPAGLSMKAYYRVRLLLAPLAGVLLAIVCCSFFC